MYTLILKAVLKTTGKVLADKALHKTLNTIQRRF